MNKLIISGNLTKDCRVASTPAGKTVCNFSVAVNIGFDDNKRTEYYECSIWGKRAEGKLPEYLKVGQQVVITGNPSLDKREHEGKHYASVKVFVDELELVGGPTRANEAATNAKPESGAGGFGDKIPF